MLGSIADFITRLKSVLPAGWFPDDTPMLDAVLMGLATAWAALNGQLVTVRLQSRIGTASGMFLDGASADFFGPRLLRRLQEPDVVFRHRILRQLVREHATRSALQSVVFDLTGQLPTLFEAGLVTDTGGYNSPGWAYGTAGAWGSLSLPYQVFITVTRQPIKGIAAIAGYNTPGPLARANLSLATGEITDGAIYAAIASVMPTSGIAWTQIRE